MLYGKLYWCILDTSNSSRKLSL